MPLRVAKSCGLIELTAMCNRANFSGEAALASSNNMVASRNIVLAVSQSNGVIERILPDASTRDNARTSPACRTCLASVRGFSLRSYRCRCMNRCWLIFRSYWLPERFSEALV